MNKWDYAKVVQALMSSAEKLSAACSAAQGAKDEDLFLAIYQKQTELFDLAASLIKDK
jgi:hypothetical protein